MSAADEIAVMRCAVQAAGEARRRATTPQARASFSHVQRRLRARIRRFKAGATWATLAAEGDKAAQAIVAYESQVAAGPV